MAAMQRRTKVGMGNMETFQSQTRGFESDLRGLISAASREYIEFDLICWETLRVETWSGFIPMIPCLLMF